MMVPKAVKSPPSFSSQMCCVRYGCHDNDFAIAHSHDTSKSTELNTINWGLFSHHLFIHIGTDTCPDSTAASLHHYTCSKQALQWLGPWHMCTKKIQQSRFCFRYPIYLGAKESLEQPTTFTLSHQLPWLLSLLLLCFELCARN